MSDSVYNSNVARFLQVVPDHAGGARCSDWQTAEQKRMDAYWRHYRCETYVDCQHGWDGKPEDNPEYNSAVVRGQAIPSGFYSVDADMPLKSRRPDVPYYLARAIVPKFTGLIFSAKRHPKIVCDDPETEGWLNAFAEQTRLWAHAIQLRNFGGGMGAVGLGFKFANGVPYVEVHDARYAKPSWQDRVSCVVSELDKRQQYSVLVRVKNKSEERWFWTRRLIDAECDTTWAKVPVADDGSEPNWDAYDCTRVQHGFGFCPVVWIANDPIDEGTQGDPDCFGIFEIMRKMDALLSQAAKGTLASCDPTLAISSDAEFDGVRKGSDQAIQIEKGGAINYVEMSGAGIDRAQKMVDDLEGKALTVARCNLDRNVRNTSSRSVEEVEHQYSSMIERADIFREQYGERGIKVMLDMVLKVARLYAQAKVVENPDGAVRIVRQRIKVPKLKIAVGDSWEYVEREVGRGEEVTLKWPPYYTPGLGEITQAVQAAGNALASFRIVDLKNAVEFVAPYLGIESVEDTVESIKRETPLVGGPADALGELTNGLVQPRPMPAK